MSTTIHVANPNSNALVTDGIAAALTMFSGLNGIEIHCSTLEQGPIGIESQAHMDAVAAPLRELVINDGSSDAFVIACYSDPGLAACREATTRPVFGIAESGLMVALTRGDRFGVIAIANPSIKRHSRYMRQLGVLDRCAGERSLDMSVAETASGAQTLEKMISTGRALRDEDGAEVIVMGCAGMARHRRALESTLDIPVIDPTQAAVSMAVGTLLVAKD